MKRSVHVSLIFAAGLAVGCASTTSVAPQIAKPRSNERLETRHLVLIVDASESVDLDSMYDPKMRLVESFVESMPSGSYSTYLSGFGGQLRETTSQAQFDRAELTKAAGNLHHLRGTTPISQILGSEVAGELAGTRGRAAVVLISDGIPSDASGSFEAQPALAAARQLARSRSDETCFHAVQVGRNRSAAAFMRSLAATTPCGSYRAFDGSTDFASIEPIERDVFFATTALPPVAAPPPAKPSDRDGDGFADHSDACPDSPRGAPVDTRGCWLVRGAHFAVDSDRIESRDAAKLQEVAKVMQANPDVRVRLDGHTDVTGNADYNMGLSKRRADAVRSYLVAAGVASDRIQMNAWGADRPMADGRSRDALARNRRVDVELVR